MQRRAFTMLLPHSQAIEGHASNVAHCCEVAPSGTVALLPLPTVSVPPEQATTRPKATSVAKERTCIGARLCTSLGLAPPGPPVSAGTTAAAEAAMSGVDQREHAMFRR